MNESKSKSKLERIGASNSQTCWVVDTRGFLGKETTPSTSTTDSLVSDLANATICALTPAPAASAHCTELLPSRSTTNAILPRERISCANPRTSTERPAAAAAAAAASRPLTLVHERPVTALDRVSSTGTSPQLAAKGSSAPGAGGCC